MEIKLKIGAISRDNSEYCHYAIPENRAEDREKPRKISRIRAWGDRAEISPTPNIGYLIPHDVEPFDVANSALPAQVFTDALRKSKPIDCWS